jgi:hypothetical protein
MRATADGRWHGFRAFDIVANHVGVHRYARADAFRVRLEQGVADTNAEALLLAGDGKVENPAQEFTGAPLGDPAGWVKISSGDDPAWRTLSLTPDERRQVERDVHAGYLVIVGRTASPSVADRAAWWRVDPRDGSTLGMGVEGGQALTEYQVDVTLIIVGSGSATSLSCLAGVAAHRFPTFSDQRRCAFAGLMGMATVGKEFVKGGGLTLPGLLIAVYAAAQSIIGAGLAGYAWSAPD